MPRRFPRYPMLVGDYNWDKHGGTFISPAMLDGGHNTFYVIVDVWGFDQIGEHFVRVGRIDLGDYSQADITSALSSYGWDTKKVVPDLMKIEVLVGTDNRWVDEDFKGSNLTTVLEEAMMFAEGLESLPEKRTWKQARRIQDRWMAEQTKMYDDDYGEDTEEGVA